MSDLAKLEAWYARQCDGDWEHMCGVDANLHPTAADWLSCRVEARKWKGAGDPTKLGRLIHEFLSWVEQHER